MNTAWLWLRCSCGGLFYDHADLNRHRAEQPHCTDCGGQLVDRSDRAAGVCRRCEHRRAHQECGQ